jgi:hypothetical protein
LRITTTYAIIIHVKRNFEFALPAEQALAHAKEDFRVTMLVCDPFADLVMARLAGKGEATTELPEFGCEPWRFRNDRGEGTGYGVRLSFSASGSDGGLGVRFSTYDYIKVAELEGSTLYFDPLLAEVEATGMDRETARAAADVISGVYLGAYNDLQHTEVPGDAIEFDSMTGTAELESNRRHYMIPEE